MPPLFFFAFRPLIRLSHYHYHLAGDNDYNFNSNYSTSSALVGFKATRTAPKHNPTVAPRHRYQAGFSVGPSISPSHSPPGAPKTPAHFRVGRGGIIINSHTSPLGNNSPASAWSHSTPTSSYATQVQDNPVWQSGLPRKYQTVPRSLPSPSIPTACNSSRTSSSRPSCR